MLAEQRKDIRKSFRPLKRDCSVVRRKKAWRLKFQNAEWVSKLALLSDITSHMNDLNTNFQS